MRPVDVRKWIEEREQFFFLLFFSELYEYMRGRRKKSAAPKWMEKMRNDYTNNSKWVFRKKHVLAFGSFSMYLNKVSRFLHMVEQRLKFCEKKNRKKSKTVSISIQCEMIHFSPLPLSLSLSIFLLFIYQASIWIMLGVYTFLRSVPFFFFCVHCTYVCMIVS